MASAGRVNEGGAAPERAVTARWWELAELAPVERRLWSLPEALA